MAKNPREAHKQYLKYTVDVWQKLFWIKWGIDFEADRDEEEMLKMAEYEKLNSTSSRLW